MSRPLEGHEIHLWRMRLDLSAPQVAELRQVLPDDERARADRFVFERDRSAWTVARAGLRRILAPYLAAEPQALRFGTAAQGKPFLTPEYGGDWLRFNLSHSGDLALVAVARGREVGVDVERIRPDVGIAEISRIVFSPAELAVLQALPPEQQVQGFFNAWSRKEAFIKAVGQGISFGLNRFDVTLAPGEPARLLRVDDPGYRPEDWSLQALEPGPGYAAALCAQGHEWSLSCREVPVP